MLAFVFLSLLLAGGVWLIVCIYLISAECWFGALVAISCMVLFSLWLVCVASGFPLLGLD